MVHSLGGPQETGPYNCKYKYVVFFRLERQLGLPTQHQHQGDPGQAAGVFKQRREHREGSPSQALVLIWNHSALIHSTNSHNPDLFKGVLNPTLPPVYCIYRPTGGQTSVSDLPSAWTASHCLEAYYPARLPPSCLEAYKSCLEA